MKNNNIENINLSEVEIINDNFLSNNCILSSINIPKVKKISRYFLRSNPYFNIEKLLSEEKLKTYKKIKNTSKDLINLSSIIKSYLEINSKIKGMD